MRLVEAFLTHDYIEAGGRVRRYWEFELPDWSLTLQDELLAAIVGFNPGGGSRPRETPLPRAKMAFQTKAFRRDGGFRTDLGRKGGRLIFGEDPVFGLRLLRADEIAKRTVRAFTEKRLLRELRNRHILGAMAESRRQHRKFEGASMDGSNQPPDQQTLSHPTSRQLNG